MCLPAKVRNRLMRTQARPGRPNRLLCQLSKRLTRARACSGEICRENWPPSRIRIYHPAARYISFYQAGLKAVSLSRRMKPRGERPGRRGRANELLDRSRARSITVEEGAPVEPPQ